MYNGSKYADSRMPWVGKVPGTPGFIAVTDVASMVVNIQPSRVWLAIQNIDTVNTVYLCLGEAAAVPSAIVPAAMALAPGQTVIFDRLMPWPSLITAVCGAGLTASLTVNDVLQVISDNPGRGTKGVNEPITEYGE